MRRRNFLALGPAGLAISGTTKLRVITMEGCGCSFAPQSATPGANAFADLQSGLKITGMKASCSTIVLLSSKLRVEPR